MAELFVWNNHTCLLLKLEKVGLDRYGYKEEALRVAEKYTAVVEKVFSQNGKLWEKYNVVEGSINEKNEYEMPEMMGWNAGVYFAAKEYVKANS